MGADSNKTLFLLCLSASYRSALAVSALQTVLCNQELPLSGTLQGKALGICVHKFPRNTPTHWNSTYDMADFAYVYRPAIDRLTYDRSLKLRDLELSEKEWELVDELRDCLKAHSQCHRVPHLPGLG